MSAEKTGRSGEQCACEFLEKRGFQILSRNYRSRFGEIDIIAQNAKYIIFAEVKTRRPHSMVSPADAVGKEKQKRIIRTAMLYLAQFSVPLQPRFDVLAVTGCDGRYQISHLEDAFSLEDEYGAF